MRNCTAQLLTVRKRGVRISNMNRTSDFCDVALRTWWSEVGIRMYTHAGATDTTDWLGRLRRKLRFSNPGFSFNPVGEKKIWTCAASVQLTGLWCSMLWIWNLAFVTNLLWLLRRKSHQLKMRNLVESQKRLLLRKENAAMAWQEMHAWMCWLQFWSRIRTAVSALCQWWTTLP